MVLFVCFYSWGTKSNVTWNNMFELFINPSNPTVQVNFKQKQSDLCIHLCLLTLRPLWCQHSSLTSLTPALLLLFCLFFKFFISHHLLASTFQYKYVVEFRRQAFPVLCFFCAAQVCATLICHLFKSSFKPLVLTPSCIYFYSLYCKQDH